MKVFEYENREKVFDENAMVKDILKYIYDMQDVGFNLMLMNQYIDITEQGIVIRMSKKHEVGAERQFQIKAGG